MASVWCELCGVLIEFTLEVDWNAEEAAESGALCVVI